MIRPPSSRAAATVFARPVKRAWVASAAAHLAVTLAVTLVAARGARRVARPSVSVVSFENPPPRRAPPPPPPPPPSPAPAASPAPRARPAVRRAPRPAAAPPILTARTERPTPATDTAPSGANRAFEGGQASADGEGNAGTATPAPAPAPTPPPPRGPVQLPEDAVAPVPDPHNRAPEYPAEARAAGVEAVVIARIVVRDDGGVGDVQILRGHPLFDGAVRETLRTWRFAPATVGGHALAVYRLIRVPFRLENL